MRVNIRQSIYCFYVFLMVVVVVVFEYCSHGIYTSIHRHTYAPDARTLIRSIKNYNIFTLVKEDCTWIFIWKKKITLIACSNYIFLYTSIWIILFFFNDVRSRYTLTTNIGSVASHRIFITLSTRQFEDHYDACALSMRA